MADRLIAVDWGTTNRRIFELVDGAVRSVTRDASGVAASPDFEREIVALRQRFGAEVPLLLTGMIGSTIGWREVPYAALPASITDLAAGTLRVDARTLIVPGLCDRGGRPDVMRGEEVQVLGALAARMIPADALACQPGTHSKWVQVCGGRVTGLASAMTGELFALLTRHGTLARTLGEAVDSDAAFRAGVVEGAGRDLPRSLFGVRARAVLGEADAVRSGRSYLSGLLIGAEVAGRLAESDAAVVHLIAGGDLARLYGAAIMLLGRRVAAIDAEAAFASGAWAIWEELR